MKELLVVIAYLIMLITSKIASYIDNVNEVKSKTAIQKYYFEKVHSEIPEFVETKPEQEYFENRYKNLDKVILVRYIDGIPAGYIIGYDKFQDNKTNFYCWMAGVIPQYRKSGVLTAMMEYLKNWSKEQGYKNLRIKTRNTRREMLSFLVKNNFNFYEIEAQENIRDNRICLEIHL